MNRLDWESYFDPAFYAGQTGHALQQSDVTIDTYRRDGSPLGLCPSSRFDPVAFKIQYPDAAISGKEPLDAFLEMAMEDPGREAPTMSGIFQDMDTAVEYATKFANFDSITHDKCSSAEARSFSQETRHSLATLRGQYAFHAPDVSFLLSRLASEVPVSMLRYPHGLWSALGMLARARDGIARRIPDSILNAAELTSGAIRLCQQQNSSLRIGDVFCGNFLAELEEDLRIPLPEEVFCGIAFKGYPTLDQRLFLVPGQNPENDPLCAEFVQTFSRYFPPDSHLLDGTLPKRWAVSGALRTFPEYIRRRHVVLVGPSWFSSLGARLGLQHYTHVCIANRGSFPVRYQIMARVLEALHPTGRSASGVPLVLFHCGGSLAAWLIRRLHAAHPKAFYWDFGQALALWHLDEAFYRYPWITIFKRAMVQNNNLESMYQKIAGPNYDMWLNEFHADPGRGTATAQPDRAGCISRAKRLLHSFMSR